MTPKHDYGRGESSKMCLEKMLKFIILEMRQFYKNIHEIELASKSDSFKSNNS